MSNVFDEYNLYKNAFFDLSPDDESLPEALRAKIADTFAKARQHNLWPLLTVNNRTHAVKLIGVHPTQASAYGARHQELVNRTVYFARSQNIFGMHESLWAMDSWNIEMGLYVNTRRGIYGATLFNTDLRGIDFQSADLSYVDMRYANLKNSGMSKGVFANNKFGWANLNGADLRAADCIENDFSGADLRGADFRCAEMYRCNFAQARLGGALFQGATFERCDFGGAIVNNTSMNRDSTKSWLAKRGATFVTFVYDNSGY